MFGLNVWSIYGDSALSFRSSCTAVGDKAGIKAGQGFPSSASLGQIVSLAACVTELCLSSSILVIQNEKRIFSFC